MFYNNNNKRTSTIFLAFDILSRIVLVGTAEILNDLIDSCCHVTIVTLHLHTREGLDS